MLGWQFETTKGLQYITIPEWEKRGVKTAFTTRIGGASPDPYRSLNMGLHVGDQVQKVITNRALLLEVLGSKIDAMVCCEQVHGAEIARVEYKNAGCGSSEMSSAIANCDAMISNTPGLYLTAFFADCIPIFLFDPRCRAIGLAHAGWKGTMQRIAAATINEMINHFGCLIHDLEVFIGPGIGPCCFEIQEDLADKVKKEFPNTDGLLQKQHKRLTWNLAKTNFRILEEIGVQADKIGVCELCTACKKDLFFSYRRDHGITGRMGAVIALSR